MIDHPTVILKVDWFACSQSDSQEDQHSKTSLQSQKAARQRPQDTA
jgi:hypothetical protein